MFDLVKFFTPKYLFSLQPALPSPGTKIFLMIVSTLFLILGIAFFIIAKIKKRDVFLVRTLKRFYTLFFTLGFGGWLLLFFRLNKVYFLSARFWLFLWFVIFVVWLIFIIRYVICRVPQQREKVIKSQEFEKYLPRKK